MESSQADNVPDCRLYVPDQDGILVGVSKAGDRVYCFGKNPGEDYYHSILEGEIYLQRGKEVFCLRCALRQEFVTTDRLYWQHRRKK